MKVSVAVAQIPIVWDIDQNLAIIAAVLAKARPGEIVMLPEGALSGYGSDLAAVDRLAPATLAAAVDRLAALAREKAVHVFCGSFIFERDGWCNAALYLPPRGARQIYRKVNLAMHERGRVQPGSELSPMSIRLADGPLAVAVQLCREIRFPEQWQHLATAGAKAFIYLSHAANPTEPPGVWRSHLISRAAENQRFVLAANVADPRQHCPTMIVSPRGQVLAELPPDEPGVLRATIDLDQAADWYLNQRRNDIVEVCYRNRSEQ